jgi:hypothetical protein
MTNQQLGGELADKGWLVHAKENRLAIFDANYLHGVIPGKGLSPDASKRRITFMVGFWDSLAVKNESGFGASRPLPPIKSDSGEWLCTKGDVVEINKSLKQVVPTSVESVWQTTSGDKLTSHVLPPYEKCFQGF